MLTCETIKKIRIRTVNCKKKNNHAEYFEHLLLIPLIFFIKNCKFKLLSITIYDFSKKQSPQCLQCPQTQYQQDFTKRKLRRQN